MIKLNDVLLQHTTVVKATGGADGVRDINVLESALQRPFQTFGGEDLYPSLIQKAPALIESIVNNHPFVDGNKRTGYIVMRTFLRINGLDIRASEDEKYDFVISVASGAIDYDTIVEWLRKNTIKLNT